MQVVYHANYLVWCEVGRTDFIRAAGMPYSRMEAEGVGLAVMDATMRCHGAARYDELIRVITTLSEVRSRTVTFDYEITNADTGARLVTARTVLISIDRSGRTISLPPAIREMLERASV
jgi:acyl-CoA thioester hydrolase